MARTIKVGASFVTSAVRIDRELGLTSGAYRGEVGIGRFSYDDPSNDPLAAWQVVTVAESAMPTGLQRIWTGWTGARRILRADSMRVGNDRRWEVDLVDVNAYLTDRVIRGTDGIRDQETDVARIIWLINTFLPEVYDDGLLVADVGVTMDAQDYRGRFPLDVLNDCAEQTGKNFFVYYVTTAGSDFAALFYDSPTNALFTSPLRISDVLDDATATGANTITNPGFETNTTGWSVAAGINAAATSITRITTDSYNSSVGSGQLVTTATNGSGVKFPITGTFLAGRTYRGSVLLKWVSGTQLAKITLGSLGTAGDRASITPTLHSTSWVEYTLDWTPLADRADAQLAIMNGTAAIATIKIDDAFVGEPVTVHPILPERELDPSNVWSGVEAAFGRGSIYTNSPATEGAFKVRETTTTLPNRTADGAQVRINQFLSASGSENETIRCSALLTNAQVNYVRAGMRVLVKLFGIGASAGAWAYQRITRMTVMPAVDSDVDYEVGFEFSPVPKATRFSGIGQVKVELQDEKVPNGSFEFGVVETDDRINDWVVVTGHARSYDAPSPATTARPQPKAGKRALRVEQDAACDVRTEDFAPIEGSAKYLVRGWSLWNVGAAPSAPSIKIQWFDRDFTSISTTAANVGKWVMGATGVWKRKQFVVTSPKTGAYRRLIISCPSGTAGRFTYFDRITFEQTDSATPPP